MKIHLALISVLAFSFIGAARAQESGTAAQGDQNVGGYRGGSDQRGGRGGFGGMGMLGRGVMGTVTEAAPDHYTIKTDAGEVYTVQYSVNTRIFKAPPGVPRLGGGQQGGEGSSQERGMGGGTPPQPLKPTDIKIGDMVEARGQIDANAKTVGAVFIVELDADQVKRIREMEANFGKTWLAGKVTAIDGVKVTLTGALDNALHSFVADENTTFRRRREPITLADIQVGDTVRAEGAVKEGVFTATSVSAMGGMEGGNPNGNHGGPPAGRPQ